MILKDFEVLEPVIDKEGREMWLIRLFEPVISQDDRPMAEKVQNPRPVKKRAVYELQPPGLYQCLKCGAIIESGNNGRPPLECYKNQEGCGRKTHFERITDHINPDLWKLATWRDLPDLNMTETYNAMLALIKSLIVFSKPIEYKIFTIWIISTWKLEAWDAVGFPAFIGIPDSGKSRALRIIHYLAYRAPKATGVKQAAIPRLCHYHSITLLIDEAHTKLNPKTESGAGLLDFIKDSYKRGSVYIACDNNDQKELVVTRNFGFKAFAGEKSFNPALLTRSLPFWMDKADPEIAKLSYAEKELSQIRTELLNYRIKTGNPPDLGNDFILKGRTREVFESIIATGCHIGIDVEDIIEYAQERDRKAQESLKDTEEYDILVAIKNAQEHPLSNEEIDSIHIDNILNDMEWLTSDKEQDNKARRRIGYILKDMGIERKRTREGRVVVFEDNMDRLKALYRRYKL